MALKVFGEENKKDVYLKLEQEGSVIRLKVVDREGNEESCGVMLTISSAGVELNEYFDGASYGIDMDGGYVAVTKD